VASLDSRDLQRVLRSTSLLPRARAILLLWKQEGESTDVAVKLTMVVAEKLAVSATRARNAYAKPKQLINSLPGNLPSPVKHTRTPTPTHAPRTPRAHYARAIALRGVDPGELLCLSR
jgi:hypothetical protein